MAIFFPDHKTFIVLNCPAIMAALSFGSKIILVLAILILLSVGLTAKFVKAPITGLALLSPAGRSDTTTHSISVISAMTDKPTRGSANTISLFIELVDRHHTNDVVGMAEKVTHIDARVKDFDSRKLTDVWQSITACLLSACNRESVYVYVLSAIELIAGTEFSKTKNIKHELILEFLEADKLWTTKALIGFKYPLT